LTKDVKISQIVKFDICKYILKFTTGSAILLSEAHKDAGTIDIYKRFRKSKRKEFCMNSKPEPNTATKHFWEDNERFADLFNAVCFKGQEVIKASQLRERDTDVSASVELGAHYEHVRKYQDVSKIHEGVALTILGIENQSRVHYAMPLRNRLYDDLDYLRECRALTGKHRAAADFTKPEELLSGMKKEDRLHMSLRVVVYYGEEPWDGPRKLSDMVTVPEVYRPYFQDYQMPLVVINDAENGKRPYKNESVKTLMSQLYLIYQRDWEQIRKQNAFIDRDTAQILAAVTDHKSLKHMITKTKLGGYRMCKALDELYEQGVEQGMERGIEQGMERGIEQGMERGIEQGMERGIEQGRNRGRKEEQELSIRNLMETMKWSAQQAMDALKIPEEERTVYLKRL
jgi:hypothetical protein